MRLTEITLADLYAGRNWLVQYKDGEDRDNPEVVPATEFQKKDLGLFSAVVRCADGTEHPALAVKSFPHGGEHTDTFVYTRMGWLNILADGFMRSIGKYSHDVFPFDIFVASPWKGDREIGDLADEHRATFARSLDHLKTLRYEPQTGTRKRPLA